MPRMKILNAVEQEAFESPPVFNSVQRKQHFDFPLALRHLAASLHTPTHQLCFLLSSAYFKATKRFFAPEDFRPRDIEYVAAQLNFSENNFDFADYSARTRQRHQPLILKFYGFRAFDHQMRHFLVEEIASMIRSQLKPKLILLRCVDVLIREKVEVPSYFRLSELILSATNSRKKDLATVIERTLAEDIRTLLDTLLIQQIPIDGTAPGKTTAYKLTLMKKLSQSTKPSKVKERVADLNLVEDLYHRLGPVLDALALNHEGIAYHATSVIKSEVFQLARRDDEDRYLHLIAFIAHQYYRLQDNLVDVLITSLQSYQNSALREHKDQCYAHREQRNPSLAALLGYLDETLLRTLTTIRAITDDYQLNDAEKVEGIRTLLNTHETSVSDDGVNLAALKRDLASELSEDDYYRILEARSVRIQNRISPIIKAMTFQGEPGSRELLTAIQCFKDKDGAVDKTAPLEFLKPVEREAVTDRGKFRVSLYKALLFLHIQNGVKSGTLNLQHSYKYRPLDDYLIERGRWSRDKELLLERAGLQALANPRTVLDNLDEALHAQYLTTNRNILDGKNSFITFGQKGAFSLTTPTQDESEAEPLQNFFPERHYVPLLEVLATVNRYSSFLDEFQHWQQRNHRSRPSPKTFYAGLIGIGCTIGSRKMARISHSINESELEHTINWYFSVDNTHAANDQVLRLIDRLELPNISRRSSNNSAAGEGPLIKELRLLCRDEVSLIEQRTASISQLRHALAEYYPAALEAFEDWTSVSAWMFLQRFPSPELLAQAGKRQWQKFLHSRRLWGSDQGPRRMEIFAHATELSGSAPTVKAKSLLALSLVQMLFVIEKQLAVYRQRIEELFARHPDHDLFGSLPGAGPKIAPRLLSEIGDDRERFDGDARILQCYGGTAPVTKRSGKYRHCHQRWACDKHLRHAIYLFAEKSLSRCAWAQTYYQHHRQKDRSHAN